MTEWNIAQPRPWDQLTGVDRHAACLVAARAGDELALHALVHDLTPLVWHVARGYGLDVARAEDVVQTVWLRLRNTVDNLGNPRALVGYLVVMTRREAQRALPSDDGTGEAEVPLDLTSGWAGLSERDRRLWAAFGRLSRRCQELLRLTVLCSRAEYRAVAEALAMPMGSIGPTRGRCLTHLRGHLENDESPDWLPAKQNTFAARADVGDDESVEEVPARQPHTEEAPGPGGGEDPTQAAEQEWAPPGHGQRDRLISRAWHGIQKAFGLVGPQRVSAPEHRELAGSAMSDVAQAYVAVLRVFDDVETMRLDAESRAGGS